MMKTILCFFAFLYLVFSVGITLNSHFCGGELQSISFSKSLNYCKKCSSKNMKNCCKDISTSFQFTDNFSFSVYTIDLSNTELGLFDNLCYKNLYIKIGFYQILLYKIIKYNIVFFLGFLYIFIYVHF